MARSLIVGAALAASAHAQTIYYPTNPQVYLNPHADAASGTVSATAAAATYTGAAAYNPTQLNVPAAPDPAPATQFPIQLFTGGMTNLSIPQPGNFMGFSVEMSVSTQILGKNSSAINVPFLNLLANVVARAGSVQIRVGGNTQENAELKPGPFENNTILTKDLANSQNPTGTPPIQYTPDLIYMMNNISELVGGVSWYLGVPFFNNTPFDLSVIEYGQAILGDRLLGLQAANEPDLYAAPPRTHRPTGYSPKDYAAEIGNLIQQTAGDDKITRKDGLFLIPSTSAVISDLEWNPDAVWATGMVQTYSQSLKALALERYPENNCVAVYGGDNPVIPQDVLPNYLSHAPNVQLAGEYASSAQVAVANGKPLVLFETNTASCSGFVGISDAFVAALWSVDWAMTLASSNFSTALFHVGGQQASYNPFTPPPTNQSHFRQWSVGPVYYSTLFMAEAMGPSNKSQVVDLFANSNNPSTPGWAIYEDGNPTKLVLINYLDPAQGQNELTVSLSIGGGQTGQANATPGQVRVKSLTAGSVVQKGNFTWAGQTLGNNFQSDGRLQGEQQVDTVQCDTGNNVCQIKVPSPGAVLVFLTDDALNSVTPDPKNTLTFPTTFVTATINTASVDPTLLATSNGHNDLGRKEYTTSPNSRNKNSATAIRTGAGLVLGAVIGACVLASKLW
ncbi:glycoside hydrolase family 79 protein [Peniophora sp. CONT]|nr:glycoside hydrolase family 79 protein [Peniophora sp. CONT]